MQDVFDDTYYIIFHPYSVYEIFNDSNLVSIFIFERMEFIKFVHLSLISFLLTFKF